LKERREDATRQCQRGTQPDSSEGERKLDEIVFVKETDYEGLSSPDHSQESNLRQKQPPVDTRYHNHLVGSDNDRKRDASSPAGSDTSVRTAFKTKDNNTTPDSGAFRNINSPGKSDSSVRPLQPVPTFPPSDLLESAHPDDHEEFVSLSDPSITEHLARALHN